MADTLGFQAAILLTGHYGPNWQDLKTLLALVSTADVLVHNFRPSVAPRLGIGKIEDLVEEARNGIHACS